MALAAGIVAGALALLIVAALWDLVRMEIPNWISLALLALAALHAWFVAEPGPQARVAALAVMVALGLLLFARGWMGGGDVKLLMATAPLVGWPGLLAQIGGIAVAGGVLAVALIALRPIVAARVPADRLPLVLRRGVALPYAVAILAGTAIWAVRSNALAGLPVTLLAG
jgi:prepilin peptidase CpaA